MQTLKLDNDIVLVEKWKLYIDECEKNVGFSLSFEIKEKIAQKLELASAINLIAGDDIPMNIFAIISAGATKRFALNELKENLLHTVLKNKERNFKHFTEDNLIKLVDFIYQE